jgi:alternate signal-mediated exported protein
MNKKLVRGTLAGVAVIALATGGGTFAAWSDFDSVEGSQVGADQLTLELGEPNSAKFDNVKLAPGEGNDFEFVVASREGETVTSADLTMALADLVGEEDGCTSANSEKAVDNNCDNNNPNNQGEFVDEAVMTVNVSQPTTSSTPCSAARGGVAREVVLSELADRSLDLGTLGKGEAVCVGMGIRLPASATNASQGDSATFNLDFLLEQVV